jgi:hypothetical protein
LYTLNNRFTQHKYTIAIIGCGGTGGYTAEGVCRILPANATLLLVDMDRVEERNLTRQNFTVSDLGKFKSEALALRLCNKYDRAIAYSTMPIGLTQLSYDSVVVACVDNGPARRDIAKKLKGGAYSTGPAWYIDSGNGDNFGQVLIGNTDGPAELDANKQVWNHLPLPTIQQPELLRQQPGARSCADIPEQGPTINQSMAALVVEVVRRLIEGTCPWIQLYLDMNIGTLQPVYATPEVVEDMVKHKIHKGG